LKQNDIQGRTASERAANEAAFYALVEWFATLCILAASGGFGWQVGGWLWRMM